MAYKRIKDRPKFKAWNPVICLLVILVLTVIFFRTAKANEFKELVSPIEGLTQVTESKPEVTQFKIDYIAVVEQPKEEPSTPPEKQTYSQQEVEDYVRVIFGKDAEVAIAVSHHECGPTNRNYPGCIAHSDKEYSVGLFQINLYNAKHWVHAAKVPGKTMEEKAQWLKNPFNNTLLAFKIFKDWGGFTPWSAYTNGAWKQSYKKGGE